MKKRCIAGLLSVAIFVSAAAAEASDLFGTLRMNGKMLPDTELTLKGGGQDRTTRTNKSGYYSLRNLEPGKYTMTIQLGNKTTREVPVYVFPQSTEKNIDLK